MSYPQAKKIAVETIPVIDAGPLRSGELSDLRKVAMEIRQVAQEVGFFISATMVFLQNLYHKRMMLQRVFSANQCSGKTI